MKTEQTVLKSACCKSSVREVLGLTCVRNEDFKRLSIHVNSNSKALTLKSSVRSIWTYLTASPYYTTNINKHNYSTSRHCELKQVRTVVKEDFDIAEFVSL